MERDHLAPDSANTSLFSTPRSFLKQQQQQAGAAAAIVFRMMLSSAVEKRKGSRHKARSVSQ